MVGYLGVAEDVTERRRVEDMLRVALAKERQAVERLNEVDRAKTDFVSTVSHELRTPITSVLGYTADAAARLRRRRSPSGRPGCSARVESNGLRLQALIEDLLTLSRIEAGTFDAAGRAGRPARAWCCAAPTPPRAPARTASLGVRRGAGRRAGGGLRRRRPARAGGGQPAHQRGEVHPDGGRVDVPLGTPDGSAVLAVEDTGIGIPEAEQGRLFERFFRSATAQQRAIPGTGLGLSIVRGIVAGHGGTVSVTSREGAGTPLRDAAAAAGQCVGPAEATQQVLDPASQLARVERLHEVVVGAGGVPRARRPGPGPAR